ncbi:biotin/lipoyl-binding protein [Baekduia soli]|uniref:biotin carboxylase n=1 Tax=Baekduia soli TaxID=496014 RepID=A0A5B8U072_9ACTN|nr:biotin carboxylase N-terminal domain-containing protein [Baekduia soli]QEC46389.1 biotin/lipoyl-binding protein [Baekduia soli]
MLESVLIANRGEIAVRVITTARRLGVRTIAVFSDADAGAPHVRLADQAVRLGGPAATESYLSIERVLEAATGTGAESVHPGYGFLSENAAFARACADRRITFIGPPAEAMERLGDKVRAKQAAREAGVPVLPGLQRPGLTDTEIVEFARTAGALPLMVKAAAGGGGRGMRVVQRAEDLPDALAAARREAAAGFGDDTLFVEQYVPRSRHIEVQVLADAHGGVIHLGERECSLQRRHQKVVEESPSPFITPAVRGRLGAAAVALFRQAGYVGAGTAEFIMPADEHDAFYFLEVNARLQVEHPVTELVTGLDLVEQQLRIASGEPLAFDQAGVRLHGHAIEARICAEDAASGFLPATGTVLHYREPSGTGVRVDSGIARGTEVTTLYDSLLAKVITHAADRDRALARMSRALGESQILGVETNNGFLGRLLALPEVRAGELDTGIIERGTLAGEPTAGGRRGAGIAAALIEVLLLHESAVGADPWQALVGWRVEGPTPTELRLLGSRAKEPVRIAVHGTPGAAQVDADGQTVAASVQRVDEHRFAVTVDGRRSVIGHAARGTTRWIADGGEAFMFAVVEPTVAGADATPAGALEAPMPGTVLSVHVAEGDQVAEGDVLIVLESMKMELSLTAPADAVVAAMRVIGGQSVRQGELVAELVVGLVVGEVS